MVGREVQISNIDFVDLRWQSHKSLSWEERLDLIKKEIVSWCCVLMYMFVGVPLNLFWIEQVGGRVSVSWF